ncbi:Sestrin-like protein [Diplonema papillatum]|nr:Sestrin-like protein [Diplonema papillatum]
MACDVPLSSDDGAWEGDAKGMYVRVLIQDEEKRAILLSSLIDSIKHVSEDALRVGGEAVLGFVTNHGPYILEFAYQCPLPDVALAFRELLLWLKKTCLLEIDEMLNDDFSSEDETEDAAAGCEREANNGNELDSSAGAGLPVLGVRCTAGRHRSKGNRQNRGSRDFRGQSTGSLSSHSSVPTPPLSAGLQARWGTRPCSRFIPAADIEPITSLKPTAQRLYQQVFLEEAEVPNWVKVLSLVPQVAHKIYRTFTTAMAMGPLSAPYRWYVAYDTARRCRCQYWISRCEMGFLQVSGDVRWLTDGPPNKLEALSTLQGKLVSNPWDLLQSDILELVEERDWTLPEVALAICINAQLLSLCSSAKGTGLLLEGEKLPAHYDALRQSEMIASASLEDVTDMLTMMNAPDEGSDAAEIAAERFHELVSSELELGKPHSDGLHAPTDHEPSPTSRSGRRGMNGSTPPPALPADDETTGDDSSANEGKLPSGSLSHVNGGNRASDATQATTDAGDEFKGVNGIFRLRLTAYNWRDDASCLVDQLLSGSLASQLDELFSTVTTMTDNDIFGVVQNIDTSRLRQMVWYYVHGLYGIVADDIDYSNINGLVGIQKNGIIGFKKYIKYVGCLTNTINEMEYHFDIRYTQRFSSKDKVHICLLASEARRRAALIYGMRACAKHLATKSAGAPG